MANVVEKVGDDKVKLTVQVPAHDVHHAVEHAANDLAASVRIPGFRKGKVPMPLLVKRIGRERLYSEAVDSHIGGWFWSAATRARVNPTTQPEYDYELPASDHEDWQFSATVEVQPKPEPADWTQLEVPKAEAEVPEEIVQAELEALQRTVGELVPVEGRPAAEGDTVIVDLIAHDGTAQRDYIVELGSGRLVEELESAAVGLSAGEQREVAYELADGSRRTATVVLKEVKEHVLPPLDDELAQTASEFDTLDELRGEIEQRLHGQIEEEIEGVFRAAAVDMLVEASKVDPRGPLLDMRTRELIAGFAQTLQARGIDTDSYFRVTGEEPRDLADRLYNEAAMSIAREMILEAVADKLALEVTDDDIREELSAAGESDEDIDKFIQEGGADRVRDDLRLKKALDRIAAEVKPIAPELHEARESIWTPGQEQPAEPAKLWTPGSKE